MRIVKKVNMDVMLRTHLMLLSKLPLANVLPSGLKHSEVIPWL